jgi:hypothetical protein
MALPEHPLLDLQLLKPNITSLALSHWDDVVAFVLLASFLLTYFYDKLPWSRPEDGYDRFFISPQKEAGLVQIEKAVPITPDARNINTILNQGVIFLPSRCHC